MSPWVSAGDFPGERTGSEHSLKTLHRPTGVVGKGGQGFGRKHPIFSPLSGQAPLQRIACASVEEEFPEFIIYT